MTLGCGEEDTGPSCDDCGRIHSTVLETIVCDEFTDASRRRYASRMLRKAGREFQEILTDQATR